ncbi:MAG: type II secretion system protein [Candidatus Sungbacteria bacterium]|uniref:Type II secretion system protein n=2 Tax=Candidatus Sungiibacteriota bacterium TaxID=2750080 RepID=A0A9D6HPL7_9BACT|nr:type II secretion system protein [Candidatus Sungbacteria bacterium]
MKRETYKKYKNKVHVSCFMIHEKGFSLLEIIIVLGFLGIVAVSLVQLNLTFTRSVASGSYNVRANALAAETIEALRFTKEDQWNDLGNLTPDAVYYLSFSASPAKWNIVGSNPGQIDNIFTRSFLVKEVYRDAVTGKIVASGGSLDDKTLLAEVNVDWNEKGKDKNVKLQTYLANF